MTPQSPLPSPEKQHLSLDSATLSRRDKNKRAMRPWIALLRMCSFRQYQYLQATKLHIFLMLSHLQWIKMINFTFPNNFSSIQLLYFHLERYFILPKLSAADYMRKRINTFLHTDDFWKHCLQKGQLLKILNLSQCFQLFSSNYTFIYKDFPYFCWMFSKSSAADLSYVEKG